jgi:hypothetical protein
MADASQSFVTWEQLNTKMQSSSDGLMVLPVLPIVLCCYVAISSLLSNQLVG